MIREYELIDIEQINNLLNEFDYNLLNNINTNEFLKAIVYIDNKIKGVLVYDLIYDRIEIEYIIVDSNYRRQGIANNLLNYLIEQNRNVKNITLEVKSSNIPAIKLYENSGFKKIAIRKKYYKDEDGILMMKKIGE